MAGNFISEERNAIKFMIGLIGMEFALAMIFGTGLPLRYYQHWQQFFVQQEMGRSALQTLLRLSSWLYGVFFVHTGIAAHIVPAAPSSLSTFNGKIAGLARGRMLTLLAIFYIAIFRCLLFFSWAVAFTPLIMASAYDGWIDRKIAQFRFVYQSGQKHFMGNRGSKIAIYGLLLVFFLPVPVPPIGIIFWAIFLAISLHAWMKNLPKKI